MYKRQGSDGIIYFGSHDNNLYALKPDGSLKWKFKTGNWIRSSPTIVEDGTLYIGSGDGNLYAINTSSKGLADSPWPMFRHDPQHTGNFNYGLKKATEFSDFSSFTIEGDQISVDSEGILNFNFSSSSLDQAYKTIDITTEAGQKYWFDFEFNYFSDYSTRRIVLFGFTKDLFFRTSGDPGWWSEYEDPEGIYVGICTACLGCGDDDQSYVYKFFAKKDGKSYCIFNVQGYEDFSWGYGRYRFELDIVSEENSTIRLYRYEGNSWTLLKEKALNIDLTGLELKYVRLWSDRHQTYSLMGTYKGKIYEIGVEGVSEEETYNEAPYKPSSPEPEDQEEDVATDVKLSWSGGDPDEGDSVVYDIYFGTSDPPPLVEEDYTSTTYDPGILEEETTYYWKVVSRDKGGLETEGPLWSFTTTWSQPNSSIRIRLEEDAEVKEKYDIGDQVDLLVNYRNSEGKDFNLEELEFIKVNWVSSDEGIASVSEDGVITFKGNGTVRIYAYVEGLSDYMDFQVGEVSEGELRHYGNLIVVAGGNPESATDNMKGAIQYLADRIYEVFRKRGFKDEDIYYINHKTDQDLDGDGKADGIVDSTDKSVDQLGYAITEWATSQLNDGPLYLYLVDHGQKNGTFLIGKDQILTASEFDYFLDQFEDETGRDVVVMMEACFSGSFIDKLSDSDRVIFTSSDSDIESYIGGGGSVSFSQFLSNNLLMGYDLAEAFENARGVLEKIGGPYGLQDPQKYIGSGVEDIGSIYSDFIMAGYLPEIKGYSKGKEVEAGKGVELTVEVDILDVSGLKVWAMIKPPGYEPPKVGEEYKSPELGLIEVAFQKEEGDSKLFKGVYNFPCAGDYEVVYYVKDSSGNVVSTPPEVFQSVGEGCVEGGDISFGSGWNLLGLVYEPDDSKVESLLADVISEIVSVWKWKENNWMVYLPSFEDKGADYAQSKGFALLKDINSGEGFWINSKSSGTIFISGTPPQDTTLHISSGWNLLSLRINEKKSIDELISGDEDKIMSVWKWLGDTWAVYLPVYGQDTTEQYAESKGFEVLEGISPGEGFWINATSALELLTE